MRNVICLVLGGGRGTRLYPLTKYRSKPAVPLAGKYRLIDIPLSNCLNSQMNRIYVLTQFMSVSLHRHIRQTYRFDHFNGGFVELLAAQQTASEGSDWYQGTADAVRKNLRYIQQHGIDYVLILSGDQLYRMDYREMLDSHIESGADVSIAGLPVHSKDASGLGIMKIDETGRVNGFVEKPKTPEELAHVRTDPAWIDARGIQSNGRDCLASMGNYLFNRDTLVELLEKTDYQDFGKEIFPAAIRAKKVQMHMFDSYWEDIGTIKAFYESNLATLAPTPPFEFVEEDAPIFTRARFLPPTMVMESMITNSMIADGCQIGKGCTIKNSVIGLRSVIEENVTIEDSVLMGCDYYATRMETEADESCGRPRMKIGSGSVIKGAIVDKNCHIGNNVRVVKTDNLEDKEYPEGVTIVDGIPCIEKGACLPDGWTLT
ncbi:glucose-1-phosphate adenylyltransferase [Blastopirellula marina]|uniref:Glucose-1-phosphate adenylyltransferase n=1 Tax=Blastopirellula marina TaxID=124 RepID=A0A2S8EYP4_9BACT|nr:MULTISPECIES: glucose-1-phosphate adenylyltransferase [Pirellulaceae]PQO25017.1 glucose-1-phosphate adenylyltransferase [Blastopirellula marina]RCS40869.1 glucose-1-phosphate adenylyltransferase [Bremerella cremea]